MLCLLTCAPIDICRKVCSSHVLQRDFLTTYSHFWHSRSTSIKLYLGRLHIFLNVFNIYLGIFSKQVIVRFIYSKVLNLVFLCLSCSNMNYWALLLLIWFMHNDYAGIKITKFLFGACYIFRGKETAWTRMQAAEGSYSWAWEYALYHLWSLPFSIICVPE